MNTESSALKHLLAVLTVEHSQHKNIDEGDEERRVRVELLLLHEHVCSVTQVEVQHYDAHPAESPERSLWPEGGSRGGGLLLFEALHVCGDMPAVVVAAEEMEDQEDDENSQEKNGWQFLEEVWRGNCLAAGAVNGPQ